MFITESQNNVILLATYNYARQPYNRDKSWIISEDGAPQYDELGRYWFVGTFVAHLWHRGDYRFEVKFERFGDGRQFVNVVSHKCK